MCTPADTHPEELTQSMTLKGEAEEVRGHPSGRYQPRPSGSPTAGQTPRGLGYDVRPYVKRDKAIGDLDRKQNPQLGKHVLTVRVRQKDISAIQVRGHWGLGQGWSWS